MTNYHRRFVPFYSSIVSPLTAKLTPSSSKQGRIKWSPEAQRAFDDIKKLITHAPVLAYPDYKRQFVLDTDASDVGTGATLAQDDENGIRKVVGYASYKFTGAECNWSIL